MTVTETIPATHAAKKKSPRLPFLDWIRGLAALIMLQGHVFHSFLRPDLRESGPYIISQFVGGIAPAIFLFLTGVTLSFLMDGQSRKEPSRSRRVTVALRRAGYLAALAFAFRIQLWMFAAPYGRWTDIFRVDILNCMALGIASMSWMALLTTAERVHAGILMGAIIAAVSPLIPSVSGWMPEIVNMYLVPSPNYFAYFPWSSFVAFGISAGSILRQVKADQMNRFMQWTAMIGFGLVTAGQYFSNLPYSLYPSTDFWINSPGLIVIKLGVILLLLAFTFLWTHHGAGQGWSFVRQLGTTSLLVYWVHIELVYGRWFGAFKENLTIAQCTVSALVLIVSMLLLSRASTAGHLPNFRLGTVTPFQLRRVSGD